MMKVKAGMLVLWIKEAMSWLPTRRSELASLRLLTLGSVSTCRARTIPFKNMVMTVSLCSSYEDTSWLLTFSRWIHWLAKDDKLGRCSAGNPHCIHFLHWSCSIEYQVSCNCIDIRKSSWLPNSGPTTKGPINLFSRRLGTAAGTLAASPSLLNLPLAAPSPCATSMLPVVGWAFVCTMLPLTTWSSKGHTMAPGMTVDSSKLAFRARRWPVLLGALAVICRSECTSRMALRILPSPNGAGMEDGLRDSLLCPQLSCWQCRGDMEEVLLVKIDRWSLIIRMPIQLTLVSDIFRSFAVSSWL